MMDDAEDDPLSAEMVREVRNASYLLAESLPEPAPQKPFYATIVALADAHLAGGWRPIKTLPAYQFVTLGAWVGKPADGPRHWARGEGHWYEWQENREWSLSRGSSSYLETYRPTHWQPLPAPPPT